MGSILTFDVGTTSIKTCLFDGQFKVLARHTAEYRLIATPGGVVEMDPQAYWRGVCEGARAIITACPMAESGISVITITTQGETLVPVDAAGLPVCNAIVWLDSRSSAEAAALRESFGSGSYYPVTGLGQVDEAAPISKILNLKRNRPDIFRRTRKFLLLEDYLIFRLTGEFVSEKSLMSSTGYFDIVRDTMFSSILDFAEIPLSLFPSVLDCGQCVGLVLPEAASELGIGGRIMVVTGAMDQLAGALGSGNIRGGIVTETTGTALVMGATTSLPDFSHPARPTIYRHVRAGSFFVLPLCNTAGIILKWFKDEFCGTETKKFGQDVYAELGRMAASVPPCADGLLVFPYFSGMLTPVSDMTTRGMFCGVSLNTKKAHFIRAILESVAFMLRENIEIMEGMGIEVAQIRSLGGGSRSDIWSQIKADVLGLDIVTMTETECPSLGAAMLGAVGAGMYRDLDEVGELNVPVKSFEPDVRNTAAYDTQYRRYRKLYQCHVDLM